MSTTQQLLDRSFEPLKEGDYRSEAHNEITVRSSAHVEADFQADPSQGASCPSFQGRIPAWLQKPGERIVQLCQQSPTRTSKLKAQAGKGCLTVLDKICGEESAEAKLSSELS